MFSIATCPNQDVCYETDSANIVSNMFGLMHNELVARWICGGLTAVDYMSTDELGKCHLTYV